MSRILLKGGCVLSLDRKVGNLRVGDVLIDGSIIAAVGPNLGAAEAEVIDATDTIVMPGFVDTHRHMWRGILRHHADPVVSTFGQFYLPDDAYIADLVSALGAIDAGITTILDWSDIQISPEHTEAVIAALVESGIRAVFAYGFGPGTESDRRHQRSLAEIAEHHFSSTDQLLRLALAPPGPEFGSLELARSHWELARSLDARISVHAGVGSSGQNQKLSAMGRAGLLGADTTYVHCATLSDDEIGMIADTGGSFSLSPAVEMMIGYGTPSIQRVLNRGKRPSLSVDSETSAPNDIFTQMRSVISLQHAQFFDQRLAGKAGLPNPLTTRDVLEFATIEGARANGLADITGSLTPGKQADVIMLRTDRPNIYPINDPIGAVVWGMDTSNVDWVFVAGRVLKRRGVLEAEVVRVRKQAVAARDRVAAASGLLVESGAGGAG
ncbi:MAG: amidohydrolase family protein [Acidimicrobiia bacterium]